MLHLRYGIKTDIYELNHILYYKLNTNFINRIQQIWRGSLWNPNQSGLVDHDNRNHYQLIEKHTLERTRGWWRSSALMLLMLDPCLVPLAFWMNKRVCKGLLWNPNQRSLVAHDNRHHYQLIEKHTLERTRGWWRSSALMLLMLDPCLVLLAFSMPFSSTKNGLENKQTILPTCVHAHVHGLRHTSSWASPTCANYAVFDPFSSFLPSCNVLELQMNFLHFVLSSKVL